MSQPIFNFRRRKVGGIWFVRLGRVQLSFCLCRPVFEDLRWHGDYAVQHVTYRAMAARRER